MFERLRRFFSPDSQSQPDQSIYVPPNPDAKAIRLEKAIIKRSTLSIPAENYGDYDLIQAVTFFVDDMKRRGFYLEKELPQKAIQASAINWYKAQVFNGGHSQFIGNAGASVGVMLRAIQQGLTDFASDSAYFEIFAKFTAWMHENPKEIAQQTGTTIDLLIPEAMADPAASKRNPAAGRAPRLDELDSELFAVAKEMPLETLMARWIRGWPEIEAVDDAAYDDIIGATIALNPLRAHRALARCVLNFSEQLTDWLRAATLVACSSAGEAKIALGSGRYAEIEGQRQLLWNVRTSADEGRFCLVTDEDAALYRRTDARNPSLPHPGDIEALKQAIGENRLAKFNAPGVGERLAVVTNSTIRQHIDLAKQFDAAAAIDLLLRKASINPQGIHVALTKNNWSTLNLMLLGKKHMLRFDIDENGARIFSMPDNHQQLAKADRRAIVAHAQLAMAHR